MGNSVQNGCLKWRMGKFLFPWLITVAEFNWSRNWFYLQHPLSALLVSMMEHHDSLTGPIFWYWFSIPPLLAVPNRSTHMNVTYVSYQMIPYGISQLNINNIHIYIFMYMCKNIKLYITIKLYTYIYIIILYKGCISTILHKSDLFQEIRRWWAPSGTARARLRRGRMAVVKPGDTTSCWLKMMGKALENEILGKNTREIPWRMGF